MGLLCVVVMVLMVSVVNGESFRSMVALAIGSLGGRLPHPGVTSDVFAPYSSYRQGVGIVFVLRSRPKTQINQVRQVAQHRKL